MPLYSFPPIDLPAPPPTAPGTDFQDFTTSQLQGVDDNDASVSAGLSLASGYMTGDMAAADDLVSGIDSAAAELAAILSDADSEDLTPYVLAAAATDQGIGSVLSDVASGLGNVPEQLISDILNLFQGTIQDFESEVQGLVNELEFEITTLVDSFLGGNSLIGWPYV